MTMPDAVAWRPSTHEWVALDTENRVIGALAGGVPAGAAIQWMCQVTGVAYHHLLLTNAEIAHLDVTRLTGERPDGD